MQEYEHGFANTYLKQTDEWKRASELAHYMGRDLETGERIPSKPFAEELLPDPTIPQEGTKKWWEAQPENVTGWRKIPRAINNFIANRIGGAVGTVANIPDAVIPGDAIPEEAIAGAASKIVGAATSQALPGLAQIPERFYGMVEDVGGWVANSLASDPILGQATGFGVEAQAYSPDSFKWEPSSNESLGEFEDEYFSSPEKPNRIMSEALKWAHGKVFTPPQNQADKVARELFTVAGGAAAATMLTGVGGVAGASGIAARAGMGGLSDFMLADPDNPKLYELILGKASPELQDDAAKIMSGELGRDELEQRLKSRGVNFLEGAIASGVLDTMFNGIRAWGAHKLRARAARAKAKAETVAPEAAPVAGLDVEVNELEEQVFRYLRGHGLHDAEVELKELLLSAESPAARAEIIDSVMSGTVLDDIRYEAEPLLLGPGQAGNAPAFTGQVADIGSPEWNQAVRELAEQTGQSWDEASAQLARNYAGEQADIAFRRAPAVEADIEAAPVGITGPENLALEQGAVAAQQAANDADMAFAREMFMKESRAARQADITARGREIARPPEPFMQQSVQVAKDFADQQDRMFQSIYGVAGALDQPIFETPQEAAISLVGRLAESGGSANIGEAGARLATLYGIDPEEGAKIIGEVTKVANTPEVKKAVSNLRKRGNLGKMAIVGVLTAGMLAAQGGQEDAEALPIGSVAKALAKQAAKEAPQEVVEAVAKEAAETLAKATKAVADTPLPSAIAAAADDNAQVAVDAIQSVDDIENGIRAQALRRAKEAGESSTKVIGDATVEKMAARGASKARIAMMQKGGLLEKDVWAAITYADDSMKLAQDLGRRFLAGEQVEDAFLKAMNIAITANQSAMGVRSTMGRAFRLLQRGADGKLMMLKKALMEAEEVTPKSLMASRIEGATSTKQLAEIMMGLSPDDAARRVAQVADPTWRDVVMELFYFGKLSHPRTHLKNATSFVKNSGLNVVEKYYAAAINKATGGHGVTEFEDATNTMIGYFKGHQEALAQARLFNKNQHHVDLHFSGDSKFDIAGRSVAEARSPEVWAAWATSKGIHPENPLYKVGMYMSHMLNMPGKALANVDQYAKVMHYYADMYAEAARRGIAEGSDEWTAMMKGGEGFEDLAARLKQKSRIYTYTNDMVNSPELGFQWMGEAGEALRRQQIKNPAVRLLNPFIKTQANAARFNMERLPLIGTLNKKWMNDVVGPSATPATREAALAKQGVALTGLGIFAMWAQQGLLTGSAPKDPAQRQVWLQAHPEHAFRPFAGAPWIQYDPQSWLGTLLRGSADVARAVGTDGEASAMDVLSGLVVLAREGLEGQNFLEPFQELMGAVGLGKYGSDKEPGEAFAKDIARFFKRQTSVGIVSAAGELVDPHIKEVNTLADAMNATIPGLGTLMLDINGEPMTYGYGYDEEMIPSALRMVGVTVANRDDPHAMELAELGVSVARPKRMGKTKLTAEQTNQVLAWAGPKAKAARDNLMGSDMWKEMPDEFKEDIIKKIYSKYFTAGKRMLLTDPVFQQKYMEDLYGERLKEK